MVNRAALASLPELSQDTFNLFQGETEREFDASQFTLLPDGGDVDLYVNNLNDEIKKWGDNTDWRSARFEVEESNGASPVRATLTLTDHRGRPMEFEYEIAGEKTAKPLRVELIVHAR